MKEEPRQYERALARAAEIAKEVAQLARSVLGENTEVIWFGSWPRGIAMPHSDIDVAVSTAAPIPLERMGVLQEAVDDLATLYQIDIMDLNATGPALREEILKRGQRL